MLQTPERLSEWMQTAPALPSHCIRELNPARTGGRSQAGKDLMNRDLVLAGRDV